MGHLVPAAAHPPELPLIVLYGTDPLAPGELVIPPTCWRTCLTSGLVNSSRASRPSPARSILWVGRGRPPGEGSVELKEQSQGLEEDPELGEGEVVRGVVAAAPLCPGWTSKTVNVRVHLRDVLAVVECPVDGRPAVVELVEPHHIPDASRHLASVRLHPTPWPGTGRHCCSGPGPPTAPSSAWPAPHPSCRAAPPPPSPSPPPLPSSGRYLASKGQMMTRQQRLSAQVFTTTCYLAPRPPWTIVPF